MYYTFLAHANAFTNVKISTINKSKMLPKQSFFISIQCYIVLSFNYLHLGAFPSKHKYIPYQNIMYHLIYYIFID